VFVSQQGEGSDSKAGAELLDIVLKRVSDNSVTSCLVYVLTKENRDDQIAYKFIFLKNCFGLLAMHGIWIYNLIFDMLI